jgi:hypothetical protein
MGCSPLIDEEGIYDPRQPNDRLLLGMKGTMSEMELSIFRLRANEAKKLKAKRGELFTTVAVGYRRAADDRIEKEPDRRVQQALALVFKKFAEFQSIRQVHRWLRQEALHCRALPMVQKDVTLSGSCRSIKASIICSSIPPTPVRTHSGERRIAFGSRAGVSGCCVGTDKCVKIGRYCSSIIMTDTSPGRSTRGING